MTPSDRMRLMAWNCRGMGGTSTISQLNESIRVHLPELVFICETKQSRGSMGIVSKRLKFENIWEVRDPIGKKEGMLIAWKDSVHIKSFWRNDFCIEVQLESDDANDSFWVIFVHASIDPKERQNQWTELKLRKQRWRERWVLGGNLNDIKSQEEKEGGRVR